MDDPPEFGPDPRDVVAIQLIVPAENPSGPPWIGVWEMFAPGFINSEHPWAWMEQVIEYIIANCPLSPEHTRKNGEWLVKPTVERALFGGAQ